MRNVLRRAGYQVLLVDEFRTTAACSRCKREDFECVEKELKNKKSPRSAGVQNMQQAVDKRLQLCAQHCKNGKVGPQE